MHCRFALGSGRVRAFGLAASIGLACSLAQPPQPPASPPTAEVTTRDAPVTFKTKVNLVSVPVVARDAQGHTVGNLEREDFQLSDSGKPQIVSRFSVEKLGAPAPAPPLGTGAPPALPVTAVAPAPPPAMPDRFVAYFFDDVNMQFTDFAPVRDAVNRHLASLRPNERAGVYTSSGQISLDFTDDRDRLRQTLLAIRPQNKIVQSAIDCPILSVYLANMILNKNDPAAVVDAKAEVVTCTGEQLSDDEADRRVRAAARRVIYLADRNIQYALTAFDALVRKLSMMAGQRTIVLISSGFQVLDERREDETNVFERAVRANVVVNALDARALYAVNPVGEASERVINGHGTFLDPMGTAVTVLSTLTDKPRFAQEAALTDREVMAEAAAATGGRFFESRNDLDEGIARLSAAPEYIYVLGFVPENLKLDGKYHTLKVALRNGKGITLEARRGYYAPRYSADPAERAKEEIEEAVFSRGETHDIPVVMQTQFFKTGDYDATLSVSAKVDVRQLSFRKEDGRNRNDLTVVAGLFDRNGNYVTGTQKVVELRLRDETLQNRLGSGIVVRTTFNVAPGEYLIRLVVRDAEGQLMAAQSGLVEIP